jgi:hypothetical protein
MTLLESAALICLAPPVLYLCVVFAVVLDRCVGRWSGE